MAYDQAYWDRLERQRNKQRRNHLRMEYPKFRSMLLKHKGNHNPHLRSMLLKRVLSLRSELQQLEALSY